MDRSNSRPRPDTPPSIRAGGSVGVVLVMFVIGGTVGALAWLPAGVLSAALPTTLSCERWSGRLWRGQCAALVWHDSALGSVAWDWRLRPLVQRRLEGAVIWQRADSWLYAEANVDRSRVLSVSALRGTLALATLRTLLGPRASQLAGDWRLDGRLQFALDALAIQLPDGADGTPQPVTLLRLGGTLIGRELRWIGVPMTPADLIVQWKDEQAMAAPFATRLTPLAPSTSVRGDIQFPQGRGYRLRIAGADASGRPFPLEFFGRW